VAISDITVLKQVEEVQGRMAAIVQSSDDAIIGMDLNGGITSWNPGAESIFGFRAGEMVGASVLRLVPANRRAEEKLLLGKIKASKTMQHFETVRRTKDGRLIDVSITASPIKNAAGRVIGVSKVARDITGRKRAQEILQRNEALFSALIEQAPVGVYVVDDQLRLQQVNPRARPLFRKVRPLMGRDLSEIEHILWPKRVADQMVKHFRHTLKTGRSYQSAEFTERRRDTGVREVYEWQLQRVTLPAGEHGVVCFFNDITERKHAEDAQRRFEVLSASNRRLEQEIVRRWAVEQALRKSEQHQRELLAQSHRMQEQLRRLSRQVLLAQEEERKRISRELHDVIAQTLTGINVRLAALKKEAAVNTKGLDRHIARTQRLVEKSVNIVHQFARELRPAVLDDLGLIPALHSFMKSFSARTGIRTHLTAFAGVEQLDPARRTVLYRVAQEALTNVSRHAQASQTQVDIQKLDGAVCMKIKDNGKGFHPERSPHSLKRKRLGLLGMSERVEMVKGRLTIESAPGKGTTIRAQIPIGGNGARGEIPGLVSANAKV
jgi:PAS domain S-box-containing protein